MAKKTMPMSERVARKVAREMNEILGGDEDWLRPDVIAAVKTYSLGYELSDAPALAAELVEQGYHWAFFADPCWKEC